MIYAVVNKYYFCLIFTTYRGGDEKGGPCTTPLNLPGHHVTVKPYIFDNICPYTRFMKVPCRRRFLFIFPKSEKNADEHMKSLK